MNKEEIIREIEFLEKDIDEAEVELKDKEREYEMLIEDLANM